MKKFLAMAIGMALLSTACSKEETSSTNPNNNAPASATLEEALPGTWDVTKVEQKNGAGNVQDKVYNEAINLVFIFGIQHFYPKRFICREEPKNGKT